MPVKTFTIKSRRRKPYRVNYAEELNAEQLNVVMAEGGPMLVIAGAGSGKTRTLTYRVSRLIEDGTPPRRILLLTFTNKAAREMLMRVEALCGQECPRAFSGTFHHLGNILLRRHAEEVGLKPSFSIMDREDTKDLISTVLEERGLKKGPVRFASVDLLVEIIGLSVNTETGVEDIVEMRHPQFISQTAEIVSVLQEYIERKRRENLVDFDDLLALPLHLLAGNEKIRDYYRDNFSHILVDEYQDTNAIQDHLVKLLVGDHGNLMVVGDDAQSIYSFRGANFANIIDFPKHFTGTQIFYLTTNYRSTPEILAFANDSIRNNHNQFDKKLVPVRTSKNLPVTIVPCPDVYMQAEFVAEKVFQLMDEGVDPNEIAILYRSHFLSMEIQMEFTRQGIPYEIRSGLRFFEQRHVKDILSFLRIVVNPTDEIGFKRAFKLFPTVGNRTAAILYSFIAASGDPAGTLRSKDFLDASPRRSRKAAEQFQALIEQLFEPQVLKSPAEAIETILEEIYRDYAIHTFPNAQARLDDLAEMGQYATRYESVESFLSELALLSELSGQDVVAGDETGSSVVLSTVHQAKGLEWDAVMLIGLADFHFPSHRAIKVEEGEEEERRLFYVASTRARDELILAYPQMAYQRGKRDVISRPSRFLSEVDPDLWEPMKIVRERNYDF